MVDALCERDVRLPGGDRLTPRRFQTLGIHFGAESRFDALHHLLAEAFVDGPGGKELSDAFLRGVDAAVSFATQPLYALMHESVYCQGGRPAGRPTASGPSSRVRPGRDGPVRFTGR